MYKPAEYSGIFLSLPVLGQAVVNNNKNFTLQLYDNGKHLDYSIILDLSRLTVRNYHEPR